MAEEIGLEPETETLGGGEVLRMVLPYLELAMGTEGRFNSWSHH